MNPERSSSSKTLTLTAMSLGFVVVQLDVTIVNVALKAISDSLRGDVSALQWVVNAYTIVFASFILTAGTIGDILGAKRIFAIGFLISTAASLGCAMSPDIITLIAFRILQGIGGAMLVPCSLTLLNHAFPSAKERAHAVGIWAAGASLALAAGPVIGGILIAAIGWRSIFFINLPIGLVGIWLTWKYTRETPSTHVHKLDYWGQALAVFTLADLAWANIEGGKAGWTDPRILIAFALFFISAFLFIQRERMAKEPMLSLGLFSNAVFSAAAGIGLLINVAFYGLIFVLSIFMQQVRHYTALETGLAFLPITALVLPANLSAGRLVVWLGSRKLILLALFLTFAGCLALVPVTQNTSYMYMVLPFLCLGGGLGLIVPTITSSILGSVEKTRSGAASGVLNASRQVGSVIGVALFGSFIARETAFVHGLHIALIVSCAAFLASCLLVCLLPSKSRVA